MGANLVLNLRFREGILYYMDAVKLAKAHGMAFLENNGYIMLSEVYHFLGDYERGIEYGRKAVEYFEFIKNYRRLADSLTHVLPSELAVGRLSKAKEDIDKLLKIATSLNYPPAWVAYLFMGAVSEMEGGDGSQYFEVG